MGSSGFDDDDIDRAMHRTNHRSSTTNNNTMTHAISMLEMNDIHDMVQFGEAMSALDVSPPKQMTKNDDGGGGGFFIDGSDSSDRSHSPPSYEEDNNNINSGGKNNVIQMPPQENAPSTTNVYVGGMRRVVSMATLSEVQEAHGVQSPPSPLSVDENDAHNCVGAEYDMPLSVEEEDRDTTKPPRRSGSGSNNRMNMPLRSSLKKDSMNSLRSSLSKSAGSIGSDGSPSINSNSMKRNVSFSSLEIRQYNVTLGDAPCSNAISLDWKYDPTATEQHDIDQYEQYRTDEAPRRVRSELVMPPAHRNYLLMREAGFSRYEINAAMKEAMLVAKQREKTAKHIKFQPYEEMLEKTKRKLGKIGRMKKSNRVNH